MILCLVTELISWQDEALCNRRITFMGKQTNKQKTKLSEPTTAPYPGASCPRPLGRRVCVDLCSCSFGACCFVRARAREACSIACICLFGPRLIPRYTSGGTYDPQKGWSSTPIIVARICTIPYRVLSWHIREGCDPFSPLVFTITRRVLR